MMARVWKSFLLISGSVLGLSGVLAGSSKSTQRAQTLDFNRDIRPILANNCFKCHGSDPAGVMAGLRLDDAKSATSALKDGKHAIVPGRPNESELVRRIMAKDEDERMPPPFTHKSLKDSEKQTIIKWIEEGAIYKEHWAFVAPIRNAPPSVKLTSWPKGDIDRFVLAKMESAGLEPMPEADRSTLIRRVYLDLIGIPPTPKEVDAFLADKSDSAYETVVNRLLASTKYGERMAMDWLDAARYADSNGYQADFERYQWRWRDWVINAYNSNMPYDQFVREQVAGDMLTNSTLDQKIATGFQRNHRINTEGGVIAEEWRVETVIDRVETTTTAFLGLTTGCARCHDHKYDPISQKDFYRLFAYFNNVPESGTGEERPINHPPFIKAPTVGQTQQLEATKSRLDELESRIKSSVDSNIDRFKNESVKPREMPDPLKSSLSFSARFDPEGMAMQKAVVVHGKPAYSYGRSTGSVAVNNDNWLELGQVGDVDSKDSFSYGAWIYPIDGNGSPLARMDAGNDFRGWDIFLDGGAVLVHLINKWPNNALKEFTKARIPLKSWTHVFVTYDGSQKPEGLKIYLNGQEAATEIPNNSLVDTIRTKVPMTVGRRTGANPFNGMIDDVEFYSRVLKPEEIAWIANVDPATPLLSIPVAKRTEPQKRDIAQFLLTQRDPQFAKLVLKRNQENLRLKTIDEAIPTVMVMDEMKKDRDCFVLTRGQYDKHGEKVTAGLPQFLPPLPNGVPNNRLGFAYWLSSPNNPLTARVAVNRLWERLFGIGIVATSEDFGTRAEFPSHPELLDWLATEYLRLGWDTKAMLKTIVMSATYRQSSVTSAKSLQIDPQNRLLSHGARYRLQAEMIRDQALAVSGLLVHRLGGPSVRPYQPKGIWDETNFYGNLRNYMEDTGAGLYRRSMYTIWKRTAAPPNMLLFDAPTRETCRMRRARTDTPLQALTLLNDVTYLEAARVLAQNSIREDRSNIKNQVEFAFKSVLCREPSSNELNLLLKSYEKRLAKFSTDMDAAKSVIKVGTSLVDKTIPVPELASMTTICSTLLNLDETITRE